MTHFSSTLSDLMGDAKGIDLAQLTGLTGASISLLKSGKLRLKPDTLSEFLLAFPDRKDQWLLLRAWILDNCPEAFYRDLKSILIEHLDNPDSVVEKAPYTYGDKELDLAVMSILKSLPQNKDLQTVIKAIAPAR